MTPWSHSRQPSCPYEQTTVDGHVTFQWFKGGACVSEKLAFVRSETLHTEWIHGGCFKVASLWRPDHGPISLMASSPDWWFFLVSSVNDLSLCAVWTTPNTPASPVYKAYLSWKFQSRHSRPIYIMCNAIPGQGDLLQYVFTQWRVR